LNELTLEEITMSISFDHSSLYANGGLLPDVSGFKVGQATNITITLSNSGPMTRNAIIHLFWVGPNMTIGMGPLLDLVNGNKLAPPFGAQNPVLFSVEPGTGGRVTVSWTPSAVDFPGGALGTSAPGFLFAQAEIQALPPFQPGDTSALNNWNPAFVLCAQHNIQIAT
jgi:hypothetical protein